VAAATMTPIPLTLGLAVLKMREFLLKKSDTKKLPPSDDDAKETETKQGSILQNSISAKNFSDKYSSSLFYS
jgi:hypothetical protein